ncbi:MAG TPA: type VI secretion system tube protein Hcp [Gaiellaceae bacterium]|nr:type VI secretion system tube protein Hcp [Gaiellaceae bacterium]
MATYFLKIDGIAGESLDAKHKGEIELESFSWGETQQGAVTGGGGAGAGKVQMHDFHFVMRMNKASPPLLLACAAGQHLKSAVLTGRRTGKDQQEFLVIKFADLLISSYQTGGVADQPFPTDQVSFSFAQISVDYRAARPDGTLDAAVHAGWDVKANKKV